MGIILFCFFVGFFLWRPWQGCKASCLRVCLCLHERWCDFVWMWMNGFEAGSIAFHPCWFITPLQKHRIWNTLQQSALSLFIFQSSKQNSCPVLLLTPSSPSFFSLCPFFLPCLFATRQWTALCAEKAALFCLCSLFYPCANRHGRVPELDPIFHAQLSFVWHTAPDKNPNSRASLILKSNSGVERAFNHPLSVLQWLPFNLPGSRLLITGPTAEAVLWKNLHPLTSVSHSSISIDIFDAVSRQRHVECCREMSVKCHSSHSTGISRSLMCGRVFWNSCEDTFWHYWVSLSINGRYIFNSLSLFSRQMGSFST